MGMDGPRLRPGRRAWWTIAGVAVLVAGPTALAVPALRGEPPAARDSVAGSAAPRPARPAAATGPSAADGPGAGSLELCRAADFAPVARLGAPAAGDAIGDRADKPDHTAYTCSRIFARDGLRIVADVTALVGADAAGAARRHADVRAHAPAGVEEPVAGLAPGSFGYRSGAGEVRAYQLWTLDGRTQLGVRLRVTSVATSGPAALRDAAAGVARATVARLRG
jgi:hypothetical protein